MSDPKAPDPSRSSFRPPSEPDAAPLSISVDGENLMALLRESNKSAPVRPATSTPSYVIRPVNVQTSIEAATPPAPALPPAPRQETPAPPSREGIPAGPAVQGRVFTTNTSGSLSALLKSAQTNHAPTPVDLGEAAPLPGLSGQVSRPAPGDNPLSLAPETATPSPIAPDSNTGASSLMRVPSFGAYAEETGEQPRPRSKAVPVGIAISAVLLAALVATVITSRRTHTDASQVSAASNDPRTEAVGSASLGLRVESREKSLIGIRWNSKSTAIQNAANGRLLILERDQQPRTVELLPGQLETGHLYYESPADRVEFRLEVIDPSGKVTRDSFLALSPGGAATTAAAKNGPSGAGFAPLPAANGPMSQTAGPTPVQIQEQNGHPVPQLGKQAMPASTGPLPAGTPAVNISPPGTSAPLPGMRPAPRAFQAPQRPLSTPPRAIYLEPPSETVSSPSLPITVGNLEPLARVAPPPPSTTSVTPQKAAPKGPLRVSSVAQAANLVKRVMPQYPPAAKIARVQGTVRFNAVILKDGTVGSLQPVNGPPILVQAASDAVKRWVYRPTYLQNEPTEVVTQIDINFKLGE